MFHRVDGNTDDDEDGCTAEINPFDARNPADKVRQDGDEGQEEGTGEGDSRHDAIDIHSRRLARTDARDEAAVLLHIFRELRDVQRNSRIEIGEEHNQDGVHDRVGHRAPCKEACNPLDCFILYELCDGNREHQYRRSEDDGDDASLIDFQRNMCRVTAIHLTADDTFRILYRDAALTLCDFNDHDDHEQGDDSKKQGLEDVDRTSLDVLVNRHAALREARYDTGEDDERNAVADAASCDLVTEPHEETCACREDQGDHDDHGPAVDDEGIVDFQRIAHGESLDQCQDNRAVPRDLLDLIAAFLIVLCPLFKSRNDGCQQLHDDRRVDVRRDAHGQNGELAQCPAGEQVQESEQVAAAEEIFNDRRIHTRYGDMDAESENDEHDESEDCPFPEFRDVQYVLDVF